MRLSCQSRGRFTRYSRYLSERYGGKAYRVAVDAGFSCPNRGTDRREGGCSFCDEYGSRATYTRPIRNQSHLSQNLKRSIDQQIETGTSFLAARYGADRFLLYLQAFSNTYSPLDRLKAIYDYSLKRGIFRELIVATRPDCVDEEIAKLLASYRRDDFDVWVELGLQSSCDTTLERIGRGHTVADFERAYLLLRANRVRIAVHLILGLPGENRKEIEESVRFVAALNPDGIKFHDLHIPFGTRIFSEYVRGEFVLPSSERYLEYLVSSIELLPEETVVMRLSCDTPSERRAAPLRPMQKQTIFQDVERILETRGSRQGSRYSATASAIE